MHRRLTNRINRYGVLAVTSDRHHSQPANREDALTRLTGLVRTALKPRRKRKRTRPARASKQRRPDSKRKRGERKKLRDKIRE